jgi:phosphoribosylaminoimidazole-succinocarboxamide synthase
MVSEEHILAFGWATHQDLDDMVALALRVNDFLSGVMMGVGIKLVDFKIEIGRIWDGDFSACRGRRDQPGQLPPVGCAHRPALDKDVFRRDLGNLSEAYAEVARRLGVMPNNATPINKPKLMN